MIAGLLHRKRRRAKRDANHAAIVKALELAGCSVLDLSAVGGGAPDVLVGYRCSNVLLEIKNPATKRGQKGTGAITVARQTEFRASWRGDPVTVVHTAEEARAALGIESTHPATEATP